MKESPRVTDATARRKPLKLRYVGALMALLIVSPFVGFSACDRVEARRVSARLHAVETLPHRGSPFGLAAPEIPQTDEQKRASRLYSEATRLLPERNDREMRQAGAIVTELARLATAPADADPRLQALAATEREYDRPLSMIDEAAPLDARGYLPAERPRYVEEWRLAQPNAIRIARLSFSGHAEAAAGALLGTLRIRRMFPPSWRHTAVPTSHSLHLVLSSGEISDDVLRALQREYEALDRDLDLERRVLVDRAQFLSMVQGDLPGGGASATTMYRRPPPFEALAYRLTQPLRRHALAAALDDYAEALVVARVPWPATFEAADALARRKESGRVSGRRSMLQRARAPWGPAVATRMLRDTVGGAAQGIAHARSAAAACAVARYRLEHGGSLPSTLEALVPVQLAAVPQDPFTGIALKYARDDRGFRVFSVGVNRSDDGGKWEVASDLLPRRGNLEDIGVAIDYARFAAR